VNFFDLNPDDLGDYARRHDLPAYLGKQLLDWVYRKGVVDPGAMTNIAKRHRAVIAETMRFHTGSIVAHETATDETQKLLIAWADGPAEAGALTVLEPARETECVMIPTGDRRTACVSSQVGCPVGCRFCASGLGGLEGNLSGGRIVEQVHRLTALPGVERITNVVFMGMGEPLANLEPVMQAIRTLNAPWGFGISARRITVSTVGLPAAIRKFSAFELPVTLALSLHAPNDELRRELIPWAEYAPIDELVDACDAWFRKTGREITLEYLLLRSVNDRPEHARELAAVARRLRANVNLIRYNEVKGLPYDRPTSQDVLEFQSVLKQRKVNTHLRASRGRTIAAACGQLRHERREARH
jgi:23S rRNA (adenine2503-C2)-methyltransferase